jgi:hypothetical protein
MHFDTVTASCTGLPPVPTACQAGLVQQYCLLQHAAAVHLQPVCDDCTESDVPLHIFTTERSHKHMRVCTCNMPQTAAAGSRVLQLQPCFTALTTHTVHHSTQSPSTCQPAASKLVLPAAAVQATRSATSKCMARWTAAAAALYSVPLVLSSSCDSAKQWPQCC